MLVTCHAIGAVAGRVQCVVDVAGAAEFGICEIERQFTSLYDPATGELLWQIAKLLTSKYSRLFTN